MRLWPLEPQPVGPAPLVRDTHARRLADSAIHLRVALEGQGVRFAKLAQVARLSLTRVWRVRFRLVDLLPTYFHLATAKACHSSPLPARLTLQLRRLFLKLGCKGGGGG